MLHGPRGKYFYCFPGFEFFDPLILSILGRLLPITKSLGCHEELAKSFLG